MMMMMADVCWGRLKKKKKTHPHPIRHQAAPPLFTVIRPSSSFLFLPWKNKDYADQCPGARHVRAYYYCYLDESGRRRGTGAPSLWCIVKSSEGHLGIYKIPSISALFCIIDRELPLFLFIINSLRFPSSSSLRPSYCVFLRHKESGRKLFDRRVRNCLITTTSAPPSACWWLKLTGTD